MANPSLLKRELATGEGTIKGKVVIDGQPVIDLRVRNADSTMDFWINTQTFQPVKFVLNTSGQTITMVPTRGSCEVPSK